MEKIKIVEKPVIVEVEKPVIVEKQVIVEKPVIVEKIVYVPVETPPNGNAAGGQGKDGEEEENGLDPNAAAIGIPLAKG